MQLSVREATDKVRRYLEAPPRGHPRLEEHALGNLVFALNGLARHHWFNLLAEFLPERREVPTNADGMVGKKQLRERLGWLRRKSLRDRSKEAS